MAIWAVKYICTSYSILVSNSADKEHRARYTLISEFSPSIFASFFFYDPPPISSMWGHWLQSWFFTRITWVHPILVHYSKLVRAIKVKIASCPLRGASSRIVVAEKFPTKAVKLRPCSFSLFTRFYHLGLGRPCLLWLHAMPVWPANEIYIHVFNGIQQPRASSFE